MQSFQKNKRVFIMEAFLSSDLHSHLYVGDHLHPTWRDAFIMRFDYFSSLVSCSYILNR